MSGTKISFEFRRTLGGEILYPSKTGEKIKRIHKKNITSIYT